MAYPLNNSFETESAANYWSIIRQPYYWYSWNNPVQPINPTLSYDSVNAAYELYTGQYQTIAALNEPFSGDVWFEADIELVADPRDRRHYGLWMTTGKTNGTDQGFRFCGIDNKWLLTYWVGNWSEVASLGEVYRDSSLAEIDAGLNPQVGDTVTFRMEFLADPLLKDNRLIRCYVNGIMLIQTDWRTVERLSSGNIYQNKVKPGIFAFDGTIRIHAVRANEPSGLPSFPSVVGGRLAGVSNQGFPYSSVGWDSGSMEFNHINVPLNPDANQANLEPKKTYQGWMHTLRRNYHFAGKGVISGTIKARVNNVDTAISRRVQLIEQASNMVVQELWSGTDGTYQFTNLNTDFQWTVVSFDYKNGYRAVIADNLTATIP